MKTSVLHVTLLVLALNTVSNGLIVKRQSTEGGCFGKWVKKFDRCYLVNRRGSTIEDSVEECSVAGGVLAIIRNDDERNFLQSLYNKEGGYIWIGGRQKTLKSFEWPDGTKLQTSSSYWCNGQPDNANMTDVVVETRVVGKWLRDGSMCLEDVNPIGRIHWFVCEKPMLVSSSSKAVPATNDDDDESFRTFLLED